MTGDVNRKKTILNQYDLKMKNIVKIGNHGRIINEDLRMMRILFGA
jgi:hypothetical protein